MARLGAGGCTLKYILAKKVSQQLGPVSLSFGIKITGVGWGIEEYLVMHKITLTNAMIKL